MIRNTHRFTCYWYGFMMNYALQQDFNWHCNLGDFN